MTGETLEGKIINPDTMGTLIVEITDTTEAIGPFYVRRQDGMLLAANSPTATVDMWRAIDEYEWDEEYGGLASYDDLLSLVDNAYRS